MSESKPVSELPQTARLLSIVARLRGQDGCPWDREQTLDSLKPYLLDECYELLEAVDSGDAAAHREELGDVLLQVALHTQIRAEEGTFIFEDVARELADKLVRRHPHVFGDVTVADSQDVVRNWEAIKATEKSVARKSLLDGVPRHLPALQRAQRIQARAARAGFDWPDVSGVLDKVVEEVNEVREAAAAGDPRQLEDELGDLLFALVNLCRFRQIQAEDALRRTTLRFTRRFREIERRLAAEGKRVSDVSLADLDRHWEAAKAAETR